MLKKLSQKLLPTKTKKFPEYEGPIQRRIALLENTRALAVELANDCTEILKTFNQDEGHLQNLSECLALNMKVLANAMKKQDPDYAAFMTTMHDIYDEIGRAQRKFQADLKEQVIDPLNAWLLTDYARMASEIKTLHDRKRDVDKADECLAKNNVSKEDQISAEQTGKEFERQMEVVKTELLKIPAINNEHADIFYNFLTLYKAYHNTVVHVFEGCGVDKWANSISGIA